MSIQRDPDGRRSVRVEVEVPGTPEQVWRAIASGPGVSAWFVPTSMEEKVGGAMSCDFGGGMVSQAKVTQWDPPHRFAAEDPGWQPNMPPVATEWTVEAKDGGTCIVRVVHSLFASTDDWDGQLEGTEHGWPSYFRVLRRYLETFVGQPCAQVQAVAMTTGDTAQVWAKLAEAMGLEGKTAGQRVSAQVAPGVTLAGVLDRIDQAGGQSGVLIHLEQPAPGTLMVGAYSCGGVMASLQAYLYGEGAASVARETGPMVQQWLTGLLPPAPQPPAS